MILRTLTMLLMALAFAGAAKAQSYTVSSITGGSLGNVVSASSGSSTFRVTASSGAVTRQSGSAVRLSTSSANATITIGCSGGNSTACSSSYISVTITASGAGTGRTSSLQNLSVASGTVNLLTTPASGTTLQFYVNPIARGTTRTILLGFDMAILGNDSTRATGTATASFTVTAQRVSGGGSSTLSRSATATVIRPIDIAKTADLSFGTVTRPTTGSGSIVLSPAGTVTTSGTGVRRLTATTAQPAQFTISGEGGQSVTVSVPSTVTLSSGANSVTVTTSSTGSGSQVLSGAIGSSGTATVSVGGTLPLSSSTAAGTYTGTLTVTTQYN